MFTSKHREFYSNRLHIMVDVETTGLLAARNTVIQIGAKAFIPGWTPDKNAPYFEANCYSDTDFWDPSTKDWWEGDPKRNAILQGIKAYSSPKQLVCEAFKEWVSKVQQEALGRFEVANFWCKHLQFDWPFLDTMFWQQNRLFPFHYRNAWDMPTLLNEWAPEWDGKGLERNAAEEHSALADCEYQIRQMHHAYELKVKRDFPLLKVPSTMEEAVR